MALDERIDSLESELKLLKAEIQPALVDLRDFLARQEFAVPERPEVRVGPDGAPPAARPEPTPAPAAAVPPPPEAPQTSAGQPESAPVAGPAHSGPSDDGRAPAGAPAAEAVPQTAAVPPQAPVPADRADVRLVIGALKWAALAGQYLGPEGPRRVIELYDALWPLPDWTKQALTLAAGQLAGSRDGGNAEASPSADDHVLVLLSLHGLVHGGGAGL